ncbi:hypothetical protein EDC96DRAFT_451067, partial [Choanephora cucurbitarum]
FGSSIRGHAHPYGSQKAKNHSLYTSFCTSSERNMSQVCVFYFQNISRLLRTVEKDGKESLWTINSISLCSNTTCILHFAKQSYKPRDPLSALAIGNSGASRSIDASILDATNPSL